MSPHAFISFSALLTSITRSAFNDWPVARSLAVSPPLITFFHLKCLSEQLTLFSMHTAFFVSFTHILSYLIVALLFKLTSLRVQWTWALIQVISGIKVLSCGFAQSGLQFFSYLVFFELCLSLFLQSVFFSDFSHWRQRPDSKFPDPQAPKSPSKDMAILVTLAMPSFFSFRTQLSF